MLLSEFLVLKQRRRCAHLRYLGSREFLKVSGNQVTTFVLIMAVLIPLSFTHQTLISCSSGITMLAILGSTSDEHDSQSCLLLCADGCGHGITVGLSSSLGLAVPHLCRTLFSTSNHIVLMPAVALVGAALALFCNLIARMPGFEGALPINSVTALIGAPIVSVLFGKRRNEINS